GAVGSGGVIGSVGRIVSPQQGQTCVSSASRPKRPPKPPPISTQPVVMPTPRQNLMLRSNGSSESASLPPRAPPPPPRALPPAGRRPTPRMLTATNPGRTYLPLA